MHHPEDGTHALVERLAEAFDVARDPVRAAAMAAYMRHQFPFLGIPVPRQVAIARQLVAGLPPPAGDSELAAVTLASWKMPEREYQHFGVWFARRNVARATPGFVPALERLLTTKSWWDTVDGLATSVTGPLVAAHPELVAVMDRWLVSENLWLARTAILHQERWRLRTDPDRLFAYCLRRAADREFFVRKAIGWALRSYAKVAPEAVAGFLARHGTELSGLSRREAERGVEMGRRAISVHDIS
jgi:3-methyladenine DNA glycosylase AlkD